MTGWHFKKEISVGHLVTILVVAATAWIWFANIDKRVGLNTHDILAMQERIDRIELRNTSQFRAIIERLDTIRDQLADLK